MSIIKKSFLIVILVITSTVWVGSTDEYTMICGPRFRSWYFYTNLYNGYRAPIEDSVCWYGKELKMYLNRTHAVDTTCYNRSLFSQAEPFKIFYVTVRDSLSNLNNSKEYKAKWIRRRMLAILRDTFELQMPAHDRLHLSKRFPIKFTPPDGPVFYQEGKMTLVWTSNKSNL